MSEQDTTVEHAEHASGAEATGSGEVSEPVEATRPAQESPQGIHEESPQTDDPAHEGEQTPQAGLGQDPGQDDPRPREGSVDEADLGADDASTDGADEPTGSSRGGSAVQHLEQEGEVAADFLERLLDIADLDGDIDVDVDGDRASVAIVDSDEGRVPRRLVGPDGRVLEALQELTRLAVQASTGNRSRLMLDVAGHRAQRRADLVQLARTAIERVRSTGEPEELEPMTAFERKVVHDEVLASGLVSESEGDEPHRYVVVLPAEDREGPENVHESSGQSSAPESGHED